jgi:cytochrome P450 family 6
MNLVEVLLYIVLPLVAAGYLFLKKKYSYFDEMGIPHIKPSFIFGNMGGVGKTVHFSEVMNKIYDECKEKDIFAGFYTMISPSLIVTDLETIKLITVKEFNSFTDRGVFVNEVEEPLTGNLFGIGGDKWKFLRNKLSPVFTSGKIKMMYSTISNKGDNLIKAIEEASKSGSVELKDISNRFTIDAISACAFGMESNTLNQEHPEFVSIFKEVFGDASQTLYFFFLFAFPEVSKFLKLKQFNQKITSFFNDVIGGSIEQREKNKVNRNDFLNMLIQLKNKGSIDGEVSTETRKLTIDEVIAQACRF